MNAGFQSVDKTMNPLKQMLFSAMLIAANDAMAQQKVESRGIAPSVKLEEVISGHLPELNGKFKLRASELVFEPGGFLGAHHHAGPGIRYVASGEVTFIQGGKATLYKTGEYFFESGDIVHTAHNKTKGPVRIIFIEILPAQWSGTSLIQPKAN